jgi:hypothetical protein
MSDLLAVITPTRGRPSQFARMVEAVFEHAAGPVQVWAGLDSDDQCDYYTAMIGVPGAENVVAHRGQRRSLSAWTNDLANMALRSPSPPRYLASLGDDHRPLTPGWDRKLIAAIEGLGGHGWAYGNDLFHGSALPTSWVCSASTVQALGWMMLPACEHLYVDNAVSALGEATGLIAYRADVLIEHRHPVSGKASIDASYEESNSPARYAADGTAFAVWKASAMSDDIAKLQAMKVG